MIRWGLVVACLLGVFCTIFFACNNPMGSKNPREFKEMKDNKAEGSAVMAKAVAAHGGKGLAQLRIVRVLSRVEGEFPLPGKVAKMNAAITELCSIPREMRKDIQGKANGIFYTLLWIAGPDGTWFRENHDKTTVSKKPADVYPQFRTFLPLESLLDHTPGEWVVTEDPDEPDLVAVRHDGVEGKTYYFDRKTSLLAKTSSTQYPHAETRFENYREVSGLRLYHRIIGRRDGKEVFRLIIDRVELLPKVDPKEFAFPTS